MHSWNFSSNKCLPHFQLIGTFGKVEIKQFFVVIVLFNKWSLNSKLKGSNKIMVYYSFLLHQTLVKKLANCSICQFSSLSRYLANDHSIQNQGDRRNIMVHLTRYSFLLQTLLSKKLANCSVCHFSSLIGDCFHASTLRKARILPINQRFFSLVAAVFMPGPDNGWARWKVSRQHLCCCVVVDLGSGEGVKVIHESLGLVFLRWNDIWPLVVLD